MKPCSLARDLLLPARSQLREIIEQAKVAAEGAVKHATVIAERIGSQDPSVHESNTSGCLPRWPRSSSRHCSMRLTSTSAGSVGCPEIVEAPKSGYASRASGAWAGNSWALTRGRGPAMADPVFIRADPIQGEPVNQTGFQPLPESD